MCQHYFTKPGSTVLLLYWSSPSLHCRSVSTLEHFTVFLSFLANQGKQSFENNAYLIACRINPCLVCCNSRNRWKMLTVLDQMILIYFKVSTSKFRRDCRLLLLLFSSVWCSQTYIWEFRVMKSFGPFFCKDKSFLLCKCTGCSSVNIFEYNKSRSIPRGRFNHRLINHYQKDVFSLIISFNILFSKAIPLHAITFLPNLWLRNLSVMCVCLFQIFVECFHSSLFIA